jgi:hypothetical protein
VQPTEAKKLARLPWAIPVDTVNTTPVPGINTTMNDVIRNSAVNMGMSLLVRGLTKQQNNPDLQTMKMPILWTQRESVAAALQR